MVGEGATEPSQRRRRLVHAGQMTNGAVRYFHIPNTRMCVGGSGGGGGGRNSVTTGVTSPSLSRSICTR